MRKKKSAVTHLLVIFFDGKRQLQAVDALGQALVGLGHRQLGRRLPVHRPCGPHSTRKYCIH